MRYYVALSKYVWGPLSWPQALRIKRSYEAHARPVSYALIIDAGALL